MLLLLQFEVGFMEEALQMSFDGNICSFQCWIPDRDFVFFESLENPISSAEVFICGWGFSSFILVPSFSEGEQA